MKQQVRERLERYTDVESTVIDEILNQLDILGLFDEMETFTQSQVDEIELDATRHGHRVGVGMALDELEFLDDTVIRTTLRNLQARILDGK